MKILTQTIVAIVLLGGPLHGARLGGKKKQKTWMRQSVHDHSPEGTGIGHRRLLQNGATFIVSRASNDVAWCIDATKGVCATGDDNYVGFRPCAFNSGPSEQLWIPMDGLIHSRIDWDTCMVASGDFLRLAPCNDNDSNQKFTYGDVNTLTQIQLQSNPSQCIANHGTTPEDDDEMKVLNCQNQGRFNFVFRTGFYELYAGDGKCVAVKNGVASDGTQIILDECSKGFSAHWRLDGDGLFHNRIDDSYCLQAGHNGAPIVHGVQMRLYRCDKNKPRQKWEWPDGFEAPIFLTSNPTLFLEPQGSDDPLGTNIILASQEREWSGDAIHK